MATGRLISQVQAPNLFLFNRISSNLFYILCFLQKFFWWSQKTHLCRLHVELCIGVWKKWAQCPEELGPPPSVGKNKIINSENEAMVKKYLTNRNTVRQKMKSFPRKVCRWGSWTKENFPQRKMEKAWDSDVNMAHTLCFWFNSTGICLSQLNLTVPVNWAREM